MRKIISSLATIAVLAAALANAADEFVADELLVGFQPGTRGAQADGVRNGLGAARLKAWPEISAEHWRLPRGLGVAQAIQALAANPNVVYAEPNYLVQAVAVPNDPLRGQLWSLHNIGQTGGTPDADMDALEAWEVRTDASAVVVGVVDSGIDYNHPDLAANIWLNAGEIGTDAQGRDKATNGLDDDGNGHVDDLRGWNFVNNSNDPFDDYSHGTHVAGTIGAVGNNGIGVAGVAWSVKLMPLKFLNASGYGSTANAVSCILYAAAFVDASGNKIVRLTSNSWGGGGKSKSLENAIKNCGALFVAAAGNNGTNTAFYPAAYPQPNVACVAATDANDALASFSNFGTWVHLAAPGVSILSTTPNNGYGSKSGTSMATPHVSGVAALVLAQNPGFSVAALKAQLLGTVEVLPGLAGKVTTSGRLNARQALGAPEAPPDTTAPAAVADLAASATSSKSVTLTWTAPGDDANTGTAYFYDIRFSRNPISTDADFAAAAQVGSEPGPQAPGTAETITIEDLTDDATWYFALKTMDELGNVSDLSNLASAVTPKADWLYVALDHGQNVGNYASVGVRSNGYWAVAYDADGLLKCAYLIPPGGGFTHDTVMNGGIGASLAYSPAEEMSISHVDSAKRLWFAIKSGSNWMTTQLESKDVYQHETSLAYAGADPVISYYKTSRRASGLYVARRTGSVWATQLVDSGAVAIYNQLAIDAAGNAAIVYSHDSNGDGSVDTLKFAYWNGVAWSASTVEAGGFFGTVAFDPVSGHPAVAHWNATSGQLRFLQGNGTGWSSADIVDTANPITGCSLAFAQGGRAFLLYGATEMRLAIRDPDPASGLWAVQVMDASTAGSLRNSFKGRPFGTPGAAAYRGPDVFDFYPTSVWLALRRAPY